MRRRVVDHIPARDADRELKLGVGGLRDVEFAVQLLQLVHGRADASLRTPATLSALSALTQGGYVGREDGEALHDAYAFLRTLEHRLQLRQLRRTHVVPRDEEALRHLGRSMGYLREPAATLERELAERRRGCADFIRSCSTGRCSPQSRGSRAATRVSRSVPRRSG
jgi:glutamate-ammonia-ligase adenylyltransferase